MSKKRRGRETKPARRERRGKGSCEEEEEKCEHIFMPLDSSGEFLACKNCGLTVNRKDLKDINFFKRPIQ